MTGIGPLRATTSASIGAVGAGRAARANVPAIAVAGVLGAAGLAGAAWLAARALRGDAPSEGARGAGQVGEVPPAGGATGMSGATGPYVELVKRAEVPAVDATDPAAFEALLRADGPGWAAADGTISLPLGDGRTLWLFGDTLVRLPQAGGGLDFVRNSAVVQDGATATTLVTGTSSDAGDFLHTGRVGEWYWPGHGTVEGDEVVVFMSRIRQTAEGAPGWNFESVGTDMLRLDRRDLSVVGRTPMQEVAGVDWGTAVLDHGDHTLVFGYRGDPDDPYVREAVVARTAKGELATGEFEYWDGKHWSADAAKVAAIAEGVSPSYSVVHAPGGALAMVSQELFFGTGLQVRTAREPDGRWSDWRTIDPGPAKPEGTISYNAQVHPEFTADGRLLASWNLNRSDARIPGPDQLDTYRPVFRSIDGALLRPTRPDR